MATEQRWSLALWLFLLLLPLPLLLAKTTTTTTTTRVRRASSLHQVPSLHDVKIEEFKTLSGEPYLVPCLGVFPSSSSSVAIILVYKFEQGRTPILSIDSRASASLNEARQWTTNAYEGRFELRVDSTQPGIFLNRVTSGDEGVYKCRMDFVNAPTIITKQRLIVIQPIRRMILSLGAEQEVIQTPSIGPFHLGAMLTLSCVVYGGNPSPDVTWWSNSALLDGTVEARRNGSARNTLYLPPLAHADRYKQLTCRAANSELSPPLTSTVSLDVKGLRSKVRILLSVPFSEPERGPKVVTVSEGTRIKLRCQILEGTSQSEPIWIKESYSPDGSLRQSALVQRSVPTPHLEPHRDRERGSSALPSSSVSLVVRESDDESLIACRCRDSSSRDHGDTGRDSIQLNVLYKPRVTASFVVNGDADGGATAAEGESVYVRCAARANPPLANITWKHQSRKLPEDPSPLPSSSFSSPLDLSSTTLVLRSVSAGSAGEYSCRAGNAEGETESEPVRLRVRYHPRCRSSEATLRAGNLNQVLRLACPVHAFPEPDSFRWAFLSSNTSSEPSNYNVLPHQTSSAHIKYQITTPDDFSTLLCWASSPAGGMDLPCSVSVVPTGKPEPVSRCEISSSLPNNNDTLLKCSEGFDGGLHQSFTLKMWKFLDEEQRKTRIGTRNSSSPSFNVSDLATGHKYLFNITAWNCDGSSDPIFLTYNKRRSITYGTHYNDTSRHTRRIIPMTAVVLGGVVTLITSLVVLLCCVRLRCCGGRKTDEEDHDAEEYDDERLYRARGGTTPLVTEASPPPPDYEEDIYLSAGRLVIGVNSEKRGRMRAATSMDRMSLLTQSKYDDGGGVSGSDKEDDDDDEEEDDREESAFPASCHSNEAQGHRHTPITQV